MQERILVRPANPLPRRNRARNVRSRFTREISPRRLVPTTRLPWVSILSLVSIHSLPPIAHGATIPAAISAEPIFQSPTLIPVDLIITAFLSNKKYTLVKWSQHWQCSCWFQPAGVGPG